jgi:hypothetical protein
MSQKKLTLRQNKAPFVQREDAAHQGVCDLLRDCIGGILAVRIA